MANKGTNVVRNTKTIPPSNNVVIPFITRHGRALSLRFFHCPVTDISATVAPIGVKFYMMVHIGAGQVFSLFEGVAPGDLPNPKCWA